MDERNDEFFRPLMSCELFGQTRIKWTSYGFIPQQGQTIGLAPNFFKCRHEVSISKFKKEELFHYGENKAYTYLQDCKEGSSIVLKRVFFVVCSTYFFNFRL